MSGFRRLSVFQRSMMLWRDMWEHILKCVPMSRQFESACGGVERRVFAARYRPIPSSKAEILDVPTFLRLRGSGKGPVELITFRGSDRTLGCDGSCLEQALAWRWRWKKSTPHQEFSIWSFGFSPFCQISASAPDANVGSPSADTIKLKFIRSDHLQPSVLIA